MGRDEGRSIMGSRDFVGTGFVGRQLELERAAVGAPDDGGAGHAVVEGSSGRSSRQRAVLVSGTTMDAALWGHHAVSFDGKELYKKGQSEPLIILLVGTLMKDYRGRETISCGEAGKYYINPDIPEVAAYHESLGQQVPVVDWISAADDQYQKAYKQTESRPVKVETLISTDPNDFIGQNIVCTVTLTKVKSPSWWFLSCSRCHGTAYAAGTEFTCSDIACPSVAAEPRYKLCMLGTDGTGETVRFLCWSN